MSTCLPFIHIPYLFHHIPYRRSIFFLFHLLPLPFILLTMPHFFNSLSSIFNYFLFFFFLPLDHLFRIPLSSIHPYPLSISSYVLSTNSFFTFLYADPPHHPFLHFAFLFLFTSFPLFPHTASSLFPTSLQGLDFVPFLPILSPLYLLFPSPSHS